MQRVMVDQTSGGVRDPRAVAPRHEVQLRRMLPAPLAVSPVWPWSPLHLEWRVQFIPSPGGENDWDSGEVDYNENVPKLPPAANPAGVITIEGRSTMSSGAAKTLAESVRKSLDQIVAAGGSAKLPPKFIEQYASEIAGKLLGRVSNMEVKTGINAGGVDRSTLEDIATALESMDTLSAGLDGIVTALRGGLVGDGSTKQPDGATIPSPFHVMRSGFMKVLRLRLVDCFGSSSIPFGGRRADRTEDPQPAARRHEPQGTAGDAASLHVAGATVAAFHGRARGTKRRGWGPTSHHR